MGVALEDVQFYVGTKALITDRKGRILLLRKVPRRKSDKWKPFWDLPGGKTQGHGLEETLAREVKEEIGIENMKIVKLHDAAIANFKIHGGKDGLLMLLYRCKVPEESKIRLSKEHDCYRWAGKEEARRLLSFMLPEDCTHRL